MGSTYSLTVDDYLEQRPAFLIHLVGFLLFGSFVVVFYMLSSFLNIPPGLTLVLIMLVLFPLTQKDEWNSGILDISTTYDWNLTREKLVVGERWMGFLLATSIAALVLALLLEHVNSYNSAANIVALMCVFLLCLWIIRARIASLNRLRIAESKSGGWRAFLWNYVLLFSFLPLPVYAASHFTDSLPGSRETLLAYLVFLPLPLIVLYLGAREITKLDRESSVPFEVRIVLQKAARVILPQPISYSELQELEPPAPIDEDSESDLDDFFDEESNSSDEETDDDGSSDDDHAPSRAEDIVPESPPDVTFDDVMGLEEAKQELRDQVLAPFKDKTYEKYGVDPRRGILFYGPPGTGKTWLSKGLAGELGIEFIDIESDDIRSMYYGENVKNVSLIFEKARANAPCVLFFDEVNAIIGDRSSGIHSTSSSIVNKILAEISDLKDSDADVIIIGTTNFVDDLDSAFLDRMEIKKEIPPPDGEARYDVFRYYADKSDVPFAEIEKEWFIDATNGLNNRDIKDLVELAEVLALDEDTGLFNKPKATQEVVAEASEQVVEYENKNEDEEMLAEIPDVTFDDILDREEIKEEVHHRIIGPVKEPETYEGMGLEASHGILFTGPPGTGKTYMAQATANELDIDFIKLSGTNVVSKWVGESSKNVKEKFEVAQRQAPSLLFIDEIDQVAGDRQQMHQDNSSRERKAAVNEILRQMDRVKEDDVIVIGTTNVPDQVDRALESRFNKRIEFDYPDTELQVRLLKERLEQGENAELGAIDWERVKDRLEAVSPPFTHRDFEHIAQEALIEAIDEEKTVIETEHIEVGISQIDPSQSY